MSSSTNQLNTLIASAAEAEKSGQVDLAIRLCGQALAADPKCIPAQFILGVLLARKGDALQAISLLNKVVKAEPDAYEALMSLSNLYLDQGNIAQAMPLAIRAVELRPNDAQANNHVGRCLLGARKLDEACAALRKAIALQPGYAAPHHNLGRVLLLQGKDGEACYALGQAARIAPTFTHLLAYAGALFSLLQYDPAEACCRKCLSLNPSSGPAHLLLCGILVEQQRAGEAKEHLRKAMELGVEPNEAHLLAARQQQLGLIERANESLRRAIEQSQEVVWAYKSLAFNQKFTESDRPIVDRMISILGGDLSPTEAASMHYALAKSLEDLGEYEESMRHYNEANRLRREITVGEAPLDKSLATESVDRLIGAYKDCAGFVSTLDSELPILILGMMRSGTTLAEQILSSHPAVAAAGEQQFWMRNITRVFNDGPETLAVLGNEYIELLASIGEGNPRVTDKLPSNYNFAGFISLAVSNARIIHMRRSPLDTCISIWTTPNDIPSEGGHIKAGIVHVYKEYLRLMEFWRTVLPVDRFLEVDYEEVVSNPEPIARQMVAFSGLKWDDACLRPEENARFVNTPSIWQVRQPLYKTSMERWRRFEPWLDEFEELLELEHPR